MQNIEIMRSMNGECLIGLDINEYRIPENLSIQNVKKPASVQTAMEASLGDASCKEHNNGNVRFLFLELSCSGNDP